MKEQVFYLENFDSFEPKHIFECGQCFRWNEEKDGSYTGVFGNNVLNVKKENNRVIFKGICEGSIMERCNCYFDLDTDYDNIKKELSLIDVHLKNSINHGYGIRILKQDLWETVISFIISANNNIPRIKSIIERLCKAYGRGIVYNKNKYYTFPTPEELSAASVEDLRKLGLGFRDKRVFDTTKMIIEKQVDLEKLKECCRGDTTTSKMQALSRTADWSLDRIKEELVKLPGVGDKVAECIMLFGMNRFEVFPVDVWVRRVMNELYIKNENEEKVNKDEIRKLAHKKYADLAGIAQQYLFYWKRGA